MSEFEDTLQGFVESVNEIWRSATEDVRLEHLSKARQQADQLRQAGVKSLDDLFDLLRNSQADSQVCIATCDVLDYLMRKDLPYYRHSKARKIVDGRRALQPLLAVLYNEDSALRNCAAYSLGLLHNKGAVVPLLRVAMKDSDSGVRRSALRSLGMLEDKRAVDPLLAIVQNKQAEHGDRQMAIYALGSMGDRRAISPLITLLLDKSEDAMLRGEAAEQLSNLGSAELVQPYIIALRDEAPTVRYEAAWAINCISRYCDISPALPALDHLVAYDTTIAPGFWAVGREAIPAFESIWYKQRTPTLAAKSYAESSDYFSTLIISPALEYWDFMLKTNVWEGSTRTYVPLDQPITLQLDPASLAEELKAKWPGVRINVREPRPEALLLDWEIDTTEGLLMGGLHRDQYCVILTGDYEDIKLFAAWYRQIIPMKHKLFLYEYEGQGEEITAEE